jgi:hypothetical protein
MIGTGCGTPEGKTQMTEMGNWPVVGLGQSIICWPGEVGLLMDDDGDLAGLL